MYDRTSTIEGQVSSARVARDLLTAGPTTAVPAFRTARTRSPASRFPDPVA
jgi:hypothetical protein